MIEVSHLTKRYGAQHGGSTNLSFTIEKGRIYGFLGQTARENPPPMNILTGCLSATEGEVRIERLDIFEDAEKAKSASAICRAAARSTPDMTPAEYLCFVAGAKGVPPPKWRSSSPARWRSRPLDAGARTA